MVKKKKLDLNSKLLIAAAVVIALLIAYMCVEKVIDNKNVAAYEARIVELQKTIGGLYEEIYLRQDEAEDEEADFDEVTDTDVSDEEADADVSDEVTDTDDSDEAADTDVSDDAADADDSDENADADDSGEAEEADNTDEATETDDSDVDDAE